MHACNARALTASQAKHHSARAVQVLDRLATSLHSRCALACKPPRGSAGNALVRVTLLLQHVRHADAEQGLSTVRPPAADQVRCWVLKWVLDSFHSFQTGLLAACKIC